VPDGLATDLDAAARSFEAAIADAGGVDLQLLGIGRNGHVGFNEPSSSLSSRTRVKTLAPGTRRDNARFFADPEQMPRLCVTQGLGTIMAARQVLLVAAGTEKADAIAATIEGPVTSRWPGSVLQFHPAATIVVDVEAAARLELRDYYLSIDHAAL
jgi:glucosamine-6-phosphate deaminase